MSLRAVVQSELPFLRRYARTITGSQDAGDAAVRQTLEALIAAPIEFDSSAPSRFELFRIFHRIWNAETLSPIEVTQRDGVINSLPIKARQALVLSAIEGFGNGDIAKLLSVDPEKVAEDIATARTSIQAMLMARVMIIEDESIIALHLRSIVENLGHDVVSIARTRSQAVQLAKEQRPELILADIGLADGSSGIDAIRDIMGCMAVPVIFITAFPERLLTGERPEPTYLITKPFEPETVSATIWQALMVHRETVDSGPASGPGPVQSQATQPAAHRNS
jgi:DNA-directed RNA polymerase specialized sigma24 family protein